MPCINFQIKPFNVVNNGLDTRVEPASSARTLTISVQDKNGMYNVEPALMHRTDDGLGHVMFGAVNAGLPFQAATILLNEVCKADLHWTSAGLVGGKELFADSQSVNARTFGKELG